MVNGIKLPDGHYCCIIFSKFRVNVERCSTREMETMESVKTSHIVKLNEKELLSLKVPDQRRAESL